MNYGVPWIGTTTLSKRCEVPLPRTRTELITTRAMRATNSAYSTSVAPRSAAFFTLWVLCWMFSTNMLTTDQKKKQKGQQPKPLPLPNAL